MAINGIDFVEFHPLERVLVLVRLKIAVTAFRPVIAPAVPLCTFAPVHCGALHVCQEFCGGRLQHVADVRSGIRGSPSEARTRA